MVANAPSLAPEDQPTIAIITSLYCEKLAVDAMMDVKKTYVKYRNKGILPPCRAVSHHIQWRGVWRGTGGGRPGGGHILCFGGRAQNFKRKKKTPK